MIPKQIEFNNDSKVDSNRMPRIDGLLRSSSKQSNQTIENAEGNSTVYPCWSLGETDTAPNLDSDKTDTRHQYFAIETDPDESSITHRGVALPLCSPSATIRPLQSLVISVTGLEDVTDPENRSETNKNDRMAILMQAFWKRQLVGKVIAFGHHWTSVGTHTQP